MQSSIELKPFFLDGTRGRRFCLLRAPPSTVPVRGALVCLPPFAEEMNKCRRMMALGASAFAAAGWIVLQPDLYGCGDSEGDFGDATWEDWIDDVWDATRWLRAHYPTPVGLWAVRAGALFIDPLLARSVLDGPLLLWQPVINGAQHLAQFRRTRMAADWIGSRDGEPEVGASNEGDEIAGYRLSASVVAGLGSSRFKLPSPWRAPLYWLEVSSPDAEARLNPGSEKILTVLSSQGATIEARAVPGAQFWQTVEVEVCPPLIDESLHCLERCA